MPFGLCRHPRGCRSKWQLGTLNPRKKKARFTQADDDRLRELIEKHGAGNWAAIAKAVSCTVVLRYYFDFLLWFVSVNAEPTHDFPFHRDALCKMIHTITSSHCRQRMFRTGNE
jgi:hypothetical protein